MRRFSFISAVWASIVATAAMTAAMWFFGIDHTIMLGKIAGKTGTSAYITGGAIHLGVGIIYGLLYALIFEPIFRRLPGFFAGALYSLLPFVIAIFFMGAFTDGIKAAFGNKPEVTEVAANADQNRFNYNRDGSYNHSDCAPKPKAESKTSPKTPARSGWLFSLLGHLVYGVFLGWVYRPRILQN